MCNQRTASEKVVDNMIEKGLIQKEFRDESITILHEQLRQSTRKFIREVATATALAVTRSRKAS